MGQLKTKVNKPLGSKTKQMNEIRTNELTSGIKDTWANIKPIGVKDLRPLSANLTARTALLNLSEPMSESL